MDIAVALRLGHDAAMISTSSLVRVIARTAVKAAIAAVAAIAPLVLLIPAASAATVQTRFGAVDDTRLRHAQQEPGNWLSYGGGWQEQRYSRLLEINQSNVSRLGLAWSFEFDTTREQESTPLVVDGVMYVTSAWSKVFALDARTGREIWRFDPRAPGPADVPTCCGVPNRGAAVYHGKVYVGTLDGRLIALDAATGKLVWSVMTVPANHRYTITGAPRVARGKVFIGNAGADFGARGFVSAYDAESGRLIWRFYTVPGDPHAAPDGAASDRALAAIARPTWSGDIARYGGGGGTVWNALVYDPDFNQLYLGTGNGYPWNRGFRSAGKGDNLFVASVVALDADTGHYKWHYQETPGDSWDYDSIEDITLVDLPIGGTVRKVLLHAPKNGFFYVIDRRSGKLLSATPFVPGVNWATRIDPTTGRPLITPAAEYGDQPWVGRPAAGGAHNWNPVAFSPQTGLVYMAASETQMTFRPAPMLENDPAIANLGIHLFDGPPRVATPASAGGTPGAQRKVDRPGPEPGPGHAGTRASTYLLAWNPLTARAAWRAAGGGGGVLATAGGIVLQGRSRDGVLGELVALRATDGAVLWRQPVPDAILAGPIAYAVDGVEYVAVTSGASVQSSTSTPRARHFGRLLTFKLGGAAQVPPDPPLAPPANPPIEVASAGAVTAGGTLYGSFCARCHGVATASSNVIPDLRRSPALTNPELWRAIVIGGVLEDHGMIGWNRELDAAAAQSIRAYVGEQARALQAAEQKGVGHDVARRP